MIYISILRGINVSGKRLIKMETLKEMYAEMGFQNIKTYIQSGNVIFECNNCNINEIQIEISSQILKTFGFDVPVIVLTVERLKEIITANPFLKDSTKEKTFMHVTFLSEKLKEFSAKIIEEKKQEGEEIAFWDYAVYLYCPKGSGNTKLTNSFLETKLKVVATTRNWKTTTELLKLEEEK